MRSHHRSIPIVKPDLVGMNRANPSFLQVAETPLDSVSYISPIDPQRPRFDRDRSELIVFREKETGKSRLCRGYIKKPRV